MSSALVAAVVSGGVSLLISLIAAANARRLQAASLHAEAENARAAQEASLRAQEARLRTELRTEFMAEEAIRLLLEHEDWTLRSLRRSNGAFEASATTNCSGCSSGREPSPSNAPEAGRNCGGFENATAPGSDAGNTSAFEPST